MMNTTIPSGMKARPEWWLYTALFFSGGFFAWVWIVMLMHDINRYEQRPVFPVKSLAFAFAIGLALHFAFLFVPSAFPTAILAVSGVWVPVLFILPSALVALMIALLVLVCRHAKTSIGVGFGVRDVFAIIGLTLLMMLSFVMVQQRVNVLVEKKDRPA